VKRGAGSRVAMNDVMAPKPDRSAQMRDMFKTRSHSWARVGLSQQLSQKAARRARRQAAVLLPALAGILVVYSYRQDIFGAEFDFPVRILTVIALVILGWAFARDVGRAVGPALFRRMDPATAGTAGFLLRLLTIGIALLVALHVAGLDPTTLALGGAVTAVVLGLAAQQTLGNVFAGTVLLSARPFRVGDRVRLQGGPVAGSVEGVVSSLGLLYLTLARGDDSIMVPNSVVLSMAVIPLREPDGVNLRARLPVEVRPSDVQELLEGALTVPTRSDPRIILEEIDGDEVVFRIEATPEQATEGPKLANEILRAVGGIARDGAHDGVAAATDAPTA
jgi:small conductance mechanosensitive channel